MRYKQFLKIMKSNKDIACVMAELISKQAGIDRVEVINMITEKVGLSFQVSNVLKDSGVEL